jgi:hypothetical protein
MPWTDGRYYYRSVRENGKPRRVYVGTGPAAEAAAEEDRRVQEERDQIRSRMAQLKAEHAALDAELTEVYRLADTLGRAALYAAGFHQHCKGDWRPKRGFHCE